MFALQQACENYTVFLFGGNSSKGEVGMCINNVYEFICDDFWDELDAQVVCWQLGLHSVGYAIPTSGAYFGTGTAMEKIALDNVRCSGSETSILECLVDYSVSCGHSETAGVICQHEGKDKLSVKFSVVCYKLLQMNSNILFYFKINV